MALFKGVDTHAPVQINIKVLNIYLGYKSVFCYIYINIVLNDFEKNPPRFVDILNFQYLILPYIDIFHTLSTHLL